MGRPRPVEEWVDDDDPVSDTDAHGYNVVRLTNSVPGAPVYKVPQALLREGGRSFPS